MATLLRRRGTGAKITVGGGAFNPLTQVTALHAVWASDPSWSNPGDGNPVDSWRNQSGGGDPASTSTARPIYRASVASLNNRPAVEFDGSNDFSAVDISDVNQIFKVVFVGGLISGTTQKGLIGFGAAVGSGIGTSSGDVYTLNVNGSGVISADTSDTTTSVWRATCNSTTSELWRDEVSIATGIVGTGAMSWFKLGCQGSTSTHARFGNCYIAFCGIYDGATSDASLSTLCDDLQTYYGTP